MRTVPEAAQQQIRMARMMRSSATAVNVRWPRIDGHLFRSVNGLLADFLDADALDEVVGPLEVVGLLPVVLEEEFRGLERLIGRLDGDEQIGHESPR